MGGYLRPPDLQEVIDYLNYPDDSIKANALSWLSDESKEALSVPFWWLSHHCLVIASQGIQVQWFVGDVEVAASSLFIVV